MDYSCTIIIGDTVFSQEVNGELVLLDMETENYFGLDIVATDIWKLLKEGRTLQETHEVLLQMYDVESGQLRSDMELFVGNLVERGLASLSGSS